MDNSAKSMRMDVAMGKALRDYLERHPQAADSLEGIRQWWLPTSMRTVPIQQLKLTLEEMIATGEMESRTLPDGSDLYSRADRDTPFSQDPT